MSFILNTALRQNPNLHRSNVDVGSMQTPSRYPLPGKVTKPIIDLLWLAKACSHSSIQPEYKLIIQHRLTLATRLTVIGVKRTG
jgi:hypothetical protein